MFPKIVKLLLFTFVTIFLFFSHATAEWIPMRNGKIPHNSIRGGLNGNKIPLYISRVYYNDGFHVGKASRPEQKAWIPGGGRELEFQDFEVFVIGYSKKPVQRDSSNCRSSQRKAKSTYHQVAASLPRGSYRHTCRNCSVRGNNLECECKTRSGNWQFTSMYFSNCNRDIANCDGKLRCGECRQKENTVPRHPSGKDLN